MRHPVYTRDQKRVRHTRRPVTSIDRQRLNTARARCRNTESKPRGQQARDPLIRLARGVTVISNVRSRMGRLIGSAREHLVPAGPREKAFGSRERERAPKKSSWRIV